MSIDTVSRKPISPPQYVNRYGFTQAAHRVIAVGNAKKMRSLRKQKGKGYVLMYGANQVGDIVYCSTEKTKKMDSDGSLNTSGIG